MSLVRLAMGATWSCADASKPSDGITRAALTPLGHVIPAAFVAPGTNTDVTVDVEVEGRASTGNCIATTNPPAMAVPIKKETNRVNSPKSDRRRRVRVTEPI